MLARFTIFGLICLTVANGQAGFEFLTNVVGSTGYRYGTVDSQGRSLDCVRVIDAPPGQSVNYVGVYHTLIGTAFEVRLATSSDLLKWTFVRTLIPNADMPYIYALPAGDGYLIAHEQWMNPNSQQPSRLSFRLYATFADLMAGNTTYVYVAPNVLSNLEGTPNIYSANPNADLISVGFHFNDHTQNRDQVALGQLKGFFSGKPQWLCQPQLIYNQALSAMGVTGNIGGRDFGLAGTFSEFNIQEGNIGQPSPTVWQDWRVWLYSYESADFTFLNVTTHKGSIAFGNPGVAFLTSPNGQSSVAFVSYFMFSQGAKPGEAGSLVFYTNYP